MGKHKDRKLYFQMKIKYKPLEYKPIGVFLLKKYSGNTEVPNY